MPSTVSEGRLKLIVRKQGQDDAGRAALFHLTHRNFRLSQWITRRPTGTLRADRRKRKRSCQANALCQPDVLAPPKFGALDRHTGSERRSQLRVVRFAPQRPVTVRPQAFPKTVFLWKMSQQLVQIGKRNADRDPTILRWDALEI